MKKAPSLQGSIRAIGEMLRRGEASALEIVDERLARIEALQPIVNAFIEVDVETARASALASDRRRATGLSLGILDGTPLGLKDMFSTPGRCCSFGTSIGETETPRRPAAVVQRLRDAGAINLGFLNMAPFALGATGHNPTFGDCRNPWSIDRITGGSSSGAGAAVSAGLVAGAVGSDTGGSARIPAACCGVVGLRPTSGRISRQGAMPLAGSFDVVGPLGSSVDDVALLFSALCGADPQDPPTLAAPLWMDGALALTRASAVRIVYPSQSIASEADEQIARALSNAARAFEAGGVEVVPGVLPDIDELHRLADLIQAAEAAAVHAKRLRTHPTAYAAHIRDRIEPGFSVMATDYIGAVTQRAQRREAFVRDVLKGCAILMIPTLSQPTPTIEETAPGRSEAASSDTANLTRWTRWVSYLDLPSISIPCGFDKRGMPIGLQLVGAPFEERRLLEMAGFYEALTAWPRRPETLA